MTRWLSTVHSFHCLVLSLAQTPFELSKEPGYSLLLVLLLSQLGLLGCSSGGATPRFLHLFRFGYVVFHGANGVIDLPLPGFGYYTTYLRKKRMCPTWEMELLCKLWRTCTGKQAWLRQNKSRQTKVRGRMWKEVMVACRTRKFNGCLGHSQMCWNHKRDSCNYNLLCLLDGWLW